MANSDVFPRRNLEPLSEPWGRAIENEARSNTYRLSNLNAALKGDNRSRAGQLGVLNRQIDGQARDLLEIQSRSTEVLTPGYLTAPFNLPPDYALTSAQVSFPIVVPPPRDGAYRNATVFLSALAYNSDPGPVFSNCSVNVRVGEVVSPALAAPVMTSTPPGYRETLNMSVPIQGDSFNLEMLFIGSAGSPAAQTVNLGLEELKIVVVYGERVFS